MIALPKSLRSGLEKVAAKTGESPQKLARNATALHLDYLDWREKAIRAGFESGAREGWKSSDEVFAAVAAQRARRAANGRRVPQVTRTREPGNLQISIHRVVYRIVGDRVRIGRVLHQHQEYPD